MMYSHSVFKLHRYLLEPGDGTRYCFSFHVHEGASVYNSVTREAPINLLIPGVDPEGREYITLIIHSPGSGSYELSKDSLKNIEGHYVHYVVGKMNADPYTVCAILLALSILVGNPTEIEEACKEMLKVKEILYSKDS
jgi:hypothetical protein